MADGTINNEGKLKQINISNRRYLGSKFRLLSEIRDIIDNYCTDVKSFADLFAGTGSVASVFSDKHLIVNDILYSNYICYVAWFSGEAYDEEKLERQIQLYNSAVVTQENYMSNEFADTYFSRENCRKIGHIRADIEAQFSQGMITFRERALLIMSLLYAMDRIANTVGHYDAYRKGVEFTKELEMRLPIPPQTNLDNEFYQEDANELAKHIVADVVFLDPPYNSRQYSDAYHLLENVARWQQPPVKGVARKMDCTQLKSEYCSRQAENAFDELIRRVRARYIVLTYNNMEKKGNNRSNAKLSDEAILATLNRKGKVQIFQVAHKAFSTGKSDRNDNVERIFLCTCDPIPYISSPLNYTGGKYRILTQMFPHFPTRTRTFVDLFCGGCNVGINAEAYKVIMVDACTPLIALFSVMQTVEVEHFLTAVEKTIERFGLSNSEKNGYDYYHCESSAGLSTFNKPHYANLRQYYAGLQPGTFEQAVALYVLVVFSFNNQIRFNSRGEFNLPVGKRDFNANMKRKLCEFMERLHERQFEFQCADFRKTCLQSLGKEDFVYADPPYLVTTASYNENGGWTQTDEKDLHELLDTLHYQGCRFALSNVTESKGQKNELLLAWIEHHKNEYKVIPIERSYANANYHRRSGDVSTEVLVTNFIH